MKTCTIVNDSSGASSQIRSRLVSLARGSGSEVLPVEQNRSPRELILKANRAGCQRLIVAGGDGTVSRLLNALGPEMSELELAVIPAGTGNDLARSLGIPLDSVDDAWRIAVEGQSVPIDVVRAASGQTSYFINAATGGFGGKVAVDIAAEDKRRWGAFAYWMTAVSNIVDLQEYAVEIELDDQQLKLATYGLGIANGRYVGGGFPIAPSAFLNDGLLHLTTVPVLPMVELMAAGLNFMLLRNEGENRVKTYQSSRVRIHSEPDLPFSIDGEPTRTMDAEFEVLPAATQVVAGHRAVAIRRGAQEPTKG